MWFKPDRRADGSDLQDLMVDALTKFVAPRGFELRRDVQACAQSSIHCILPSISTPTFRSRCSLPRGRRWLRGVHNTAGKSREWDLLKQESEMLDVQVLSPMRQGTAGVEPMNKRLQALLNPPSSSSPQVDRYPSSRQGMVFRQGDRVIQTINNYDREVYNGDCGFIVQVDAVNRNLSVEFPETDWQRIKDGALRDLWIRSRVCRVSSWLASHDCRVWQ